MSISKGILKVRSGSSFVEFHPETESALITDFRASVRDNLPINVYKSSKAYAVGDCVFHEDLPTWAYLRCTQAGTTASTMPNTISKSATLDLVITDGTVKWTVSKYGVPIDAKLKSIIAQNVVKDSLLYGTGANTFALTTLSELGRQLISQATAANMRSKLSAAASSHSHATSDITNFASQVISSIGSETLAALGVSYSITTNGYICFGSLFGGLILQWSLIFNDPTGFDPEHKYFYKTKPLALGQWWSLISHFGTLYFKYFISKTAQLRVPSSVDGVNGENSFRYWTWNMDGELITAETAGDPKNVPYTTIIQMSCL